MGCTACAVSGLERKPDSFYVGGEGDEVEWEVGWTDLAVGQDTADLADYGLVAAEVCSAVKDEAEVVAKVVAHVLSAQLDREADDTVAGGGTGDETATELAWRDNILGDVVKVEEGVGGATRGAVAVVGGRDGVGGVLVGGGGGGDETLWDLEDDLGALPHVEHCVEH
jgi:hypothetical protein